MTQTSDMKNTILARFPKGYKIKRSRMGTGPKANTVAAVISDTGTTILSRDGHDYAGALINLDFQTSKRQSPRLRMGVDHFSDAYREELAAHDKEVGWATA